MAGIGNQESGRDCAACGFAAGAKPQAAEPESGLPLRAGTAALREATAPAGTAALPPALLGRVAARGRWAAGPRRDARALLAHPALVLAVLLALGPTALLLAGVAGPGLVVLGHQDAGVRHHLVAL